MVSFKKSGELVKKAIRSISEDFDGLYYDRRIRYLVDKREQIVLSNDSASHLDFKLGIRDLIEENLLKVDGDVLYFKYYFEEDFIPLGKIPKKEAYIINEYQMGNDMNFPMSLVCKEKIYEIPGAVNTIIETAFCDIQIENRLIILNRDYYRIKATEAEYESEQIAPNLEKITDKFTGVVYKELQVNHWTIVF